VFAVGLHCAIVLSMGLFSFGLIMIALVVTTTAGGDARAGAVNDRNGTLGGD
jgi:hypothetical protein